MNSLTFTYPEGDCMRMPGFFWKVWGFLFILFNYYLFLTTQVASLVVKCNMITDVQINVVAECDLLCGKPAFQAPISSQDWFSADLRAAEELKHFSFANRLNRPFCLALMRSSFVRLYYWETHNTFLTRSRFRFGWDLRAGCSRCGARVFLYLYKTLQYSFLIQK